MIKRLVLIDGHAILYRAFHALPITLTTPDGKPVNAVYGFILMLLKVIQDLKPSHLIVCFDRPKPTFRKKLFKGYQAKRPKAPDDLIAQIDLVHQVVKAMGIPIYEKDGYEADDVIGSLAFQAKSQKLKTKNEKLKTTSKNLKLEEIIIVTGDKDILQLVDENTKLYMPVKGLSSSKLYGEREVKEKFGIESKQMVDYKALIGDPSDNYAGVKGVGPKTAADLLTKFGSLEGIYEEIRKSEKPACQQAGQKIRKKLVEGLLKDAGQAKLAKKLAQIVTDVPIKLDFKKARLGRLDKPKVKELFEKLEFRSLISKLFGEKLNGKKAILRRPRKTASQSRGKLKKTENTEENEQLKLV